MRTLLFIVSLISINSFSQNRITPDWIKTKRSPVGGKSEGWGVDVDSQGNIYWPVSVDSLSQGLDIICYKFNTGGIQLWSTPFFYGGNGTQHAYVANAKDTALYVGGRECSGLINTCDMMLNKIDKATGNLIWRKSFNFAFNGYDEIDGLVIKSDGVYCGGWAQASQNGSYQSEIGLWKLNFDGTTAWTNSFGKLNSAEHQDGHFVVDNNHIYAAGLWGGTGIANLYNGHAFLGKFSKSNGNFVDSTLFGHQSNALLDIENALGMASDGTFLYVTGYTTPPSGNGWQIFIAKFDKNLNQIWFKNWGGTGTESARGITVYNGKVYVAGLTESSAYVQRGKSDGVLLTYDTSGNFISYQTWGDSNNNAFRDIVIDNNGIYIVGSTQDSVSSSGGDKEAFLLKIGNPTSSIQSDENQKIDLSIFPNPSRGNFTVKLISEEPQTGNITIRNLSGKIVFSGFFSPGKNTQSIQLSKRGVFFITINTESYSMTKKIVNL